MSIKKLCSSSNVAVILSVYKSDNPSDLNIAIQSILNQSYAKVELFIYQDGAVPYEIECILNSYSSRPDIHITRSLINIGLAKALNILILKVISINKFSFIARMDSDDISHKSRIEKQVQFMEKNIEVDVCGTFCHEFGASFSLYEKRLPISHDELMDFSITRCPFVHPSVMFRVSVFHSGVLYPTKTTLTEDMGLWFDLLSRGFRFANLEEVLIDYRLNENTISRRKGVKKALSEVKIRGYYMFVLNKVSFKNVFLILSRIVFHIMPSKLVKLAYRKMR